MAFHDLKSLLDRNIRQAGLNKQVDAINIVELFNSSARFLVGEKIARQTQAIYIRNKVLTIQCTSSIIMQEMRYRERHVMRSLNRKTGKESIERIRYTT